MDKIKLSDWAKTNGKTYKQAWSSVKDGTFPDKTEETKSGRIMVLQESKASVQTPKEIAFATPVFSDLPTKENKASVRRNRAATLDRTDSYYHIENGLTPFNVGSRTKNGNDTTSVSEAIRLTQLAYYNFSEFSNVMNVMCEFSTSRIYFQGGNKKSRDFFTALFNKINIQNLQEKFFLEYYRSGNVFPYRLEAVIKDEDINKINQVYGTKAAKNVKLPVKYIIINPSSIVSAGSISFSNTQFYQLLNAYEIQRLKKPITEEDNNFYNALPPETQKQIKDSSSNSQILLPLDPQYVYSIFWKKTDYEPLAVPMGWSVLRDLNWKAEMKAIDMAVARTTQRAILVVTMGYESKNGEYMFDAKAAEAMRMLFNSESVGKVLVADFTTKVAWEIPDVSKLLGPEKYTQVNLDIQTGLNNVLAGGNEKFANQSIKVKLFIQRLTQARESFINEFLTPEIKRISKDLNFKTYPKAVFETIDLKDEDLFARILAQLAGIGYLTPEEVFTSLTSGRIPTGEESEESQRKFKELKDEGLYVAVQQNTKPQIDLLKEQGKQQIKVTEMQQEHESKESGKDRKHAAENPQAPAPQIVLNAPTKMGQPNGRPAGSKSPKTSKKPNKPVSASLIRENLILATQLNTELNNKVCKHFKLEKLNEEQDKLVGTLLENIMVGEEPSKWIESINKYIENPDYINKERFEKVIAVGQEMSLDDYQAAIIFNSQKEENESI